jgi:hypothetical protein
MNPLELVDDLYEEFASGLGGDLAAHARDLPRALRLAPIANAPWSRVFSHEITLAAPALFADAFPDLPLLTVRDAIRAHMLSVIDAFGTDRVEDGQVRLTGESLRVLEAIHRERDVTLLRVASARRGFSLDPCSIDRSAAQAMATERELLRQAAGVDLATYERVSLGKQAAGVEVTCVMAHVAGCPEPKLRAIRSTLESAALALQLHDDVVDWEDDQARGGSWVVSLLKGSASSAGEASATPLREQVLSSDVLLRMLARARWHMRAAAARARAVGAAPAAAWAASRAEKLSTLVAAESRSAGYSVRSHALSAWATEVLA